MTATRMNRAARRAARYATTEPDVRFRMEGDVLLETGHSLVVRLDEQPAGRKSRRVSVMARLDLSAEEIAAELRLLAGALERAELGIVA